VLMKRIVTAFGVALTLLAASALRAETAPDALIERVSGEVIEAVKADKAIQAGDVMRINALVDEKVMPHVNFQRMTSLAMGRYWRQATPEQKQRLQEEF
jgi:phospholipid transport system substrate-binding protein